MEITDFNKGDKILIADVNKIIAGTNLWNDGDVVEIKDVQIQVQVSEEYYDRLLVWDKEKDHSEYIYPEEFCGIEKNKH